MAFTAAPVLTPKLNGPFEVTYAGDDSDDLGPAYPSFISLERWQPNCNAWWRPSLLNIYWTEMLLVLEIQMYLASQEWDVELGRLNA